MTSDEIKSFMWKIDIGIIILAFVVFFKVEWYLGFGLWGMIASTMWLIGGIYGKKYYQTQVDESELDPAWLDLYKYRIYASYILFGIVFCPFSVITVLSICNPEMLDSLFELLHTLLFP